jgi:hypothetical protein
MCTQEKTMMGLFADSPKWHIKKYSALPIFEKPAHSAKFLKISELILMNFPHNFGIILVHSGKKYK